MSCDAIFIVVQPLVGESLQFQFENIIGLKENCMPCESLDLFMILTSFDGRTLF